jgi:hypothetical protein
MKKSLISLLAVAAFIALGAANAQAKTVVFIHGMSGGYLSASDAASYWTGDGENSNFVPTVKKSFPAFISYRDGSKRLKDQVIDTVTQINANVSDSQIIIVAHSMGNLVTRYIMANPTSDGLTTYQRSQIEIVRNKVQKMIGLAGPNLGSVAADYVQALMGNSITATIVGWIGYDRPAMLDLRPSSWNSWNSGMISPSTFKNAAGTQIEARMLGSRDCSNGEPWYWREMENIGLCAIDTVVNYGSASVNTTNDQYPLSNTCVDRSWWGYCNRWVNGDGEKDNDGMVTYESGTAGSLSNGKWYKYGSYDSHHSNRYAQSVANWAAQFVY